MKIAVIIPCYNEEQTIKAVINDYKLFFDDIYVIDNNCTDNTVEIAKNCGANIIVESKKGKGNAIRTAFNEIDADVVVLTDGDSTYTAEDSNVLTKYLIERDFDMIIGNRLNSNYFNQYQKINGFGNKLFSKLASKIYKTDVLDLLSGSRVLSRKFYKNITLKYNGFEVETELTKLCLSEDYNLDFLDINYLSRPANSQSSLHIFKDGLKILYTLLWG